MYLCQGAAEGYETHVTEKITNGNGGRTHDNNEKGGLRMVVAQSAARGPGGHQSGELSLESSLARQGNQL